MSNDGIVIACATIANNKLLTRPNITTRGFVTVNESENILKNLENICANVVMKSIKKSKNDIKADIILNLSNYIKSETGRNPIILPIITEIEEKVTVK